MQIKNATILTALLTMVAAGARAQNGNVAVGEQAKVRAEVTFKPVMHIQLGPGAKETDVVTLALNTPEDYTKGVVQKVEKQLRIFYVGTEGEVWAAVNIREAKGDVWNNIRNIMKMGFRSEQFPSMTWLDVSSNRQMAGLRAGHAPIRYVEVGYAIDPMTAKNAPFFNEILGNDGQTKTLTIDVTYTVVPA